MKKYVTFLVLRKWKKSFDEKELENMDYKDLANLIFPNAKPISYYEEKYAPRNLPEGAIVTRFAQVLQGLFM